MTPQNVVGRFFDVTGGQVYAHVREGDGLPLVFLHYWGGSRRTWLPVLQHLDPGQAFVAYDQRGWGESAGLPGPYGLDRLADDAQRVVEALGHPRHVLVGHSMGGKVAQLVAARRPAGLAGVVLVAPAPAAPVGVTEQLQEEVGRAYESEASVLRSVEVMLTDGGLSPELRRQVVEDSLRAGDEARLAWPRGGLVQDVSAGLGDVEVPVLVLAGRHDKVDPPAVLTEHLLPLLPTASLTVLENTGHLSPLEVPDQVAAHISAFVAQL
ncbi:alpha/beta fold hydrolase [Kitasatospora sp. LaBMicrA B282]|uniref:alpha/beta fold hydrolase n=1 Tax=Kitasatospora sp. LaBMicrA B282 TaxID=3420949 RepID=UPI003D0BB726